MLPPPSVNIREYLAVGLYVCILDQFIKSEMADQGNNIWLVFIKAVDIYIFE